MLEKKLLQASFCWYFKCINFSALWVSLKVSANKFDDSSNTKFCFLKFVFFLVRTDCASVTYMIHIIFIYSIRVKLNVWENESIKNEYNINILTIRNVWRFLSFILDPEIIKSRNLVPEKNWNRYRVFIKMIVTMFSKQPR